MTLDLDVAVIGGGQAALATGFYLRRSGLRFALLDDQPGPGGAWCETWPSLRLFSPAQWSSLPGWMMPRPRGDENAAPDTYPLRDTTIAYLAQYEARYELPVERPIRVHAVERDADHLRLLTSAGLRRARAVVSATGTWAKPIVPHFPGQADFAGDILHSARYGGPDAFAGRRVVVVGGGNSGAQIVAELSTIAQVTWATREPPRFLPDDVDGRFLFEQATLRYRAVQEGRTPDAPRSLGDVVMVPAVRAARARGALVAVPVFSRFTGSSVVWSDGRSEDIDAVILATGFAPALDHLASLDVVGTDGRVAIRANGAGTHSAVEPRLWLAGYGDWTGFASATLIGVGRSARATVQEISAVLACSEPLPHVTTHSTAP